MSDVKVQHLVSEVNVRFYQDQVAARLPLHTDVAERLSSRFAFTAIGLTVNGNEPGWQATSGTCDIDQSKIRLEAAMGSGRFLGTRVEAESDVALRVLNRVWAELVEYSKQEYFKQGTVAPETVEEAGTILRQTTAIVNLPLYYEALLPGAKIMRECAKEGLNERMGDPANIVFSFTIVLPMMVDGRSFRANMKLEQRQGTRHSDKVYFTESPLPTKLHLEMLERICAAAKRDWMPEKKQQ